MRDQRGYRGHSEGESHSGMSMCRFPAFDDDQQNPGFSALGHGLSVAEAVEALVAKKALKMSDTVAMATALCKE